MGTADEKDAILAIDVKTGKKAWETTIGRKFENRWGGGPRSTPTVDGKHLYALAGGGELVCLNVKDGSKVWNVNLRSRLGGSMMSGWGYSESVLVDGDHVICTPGGNQGALAALNKKTGEVVWRGGGTDRAAYSSIVVANIGGVKQYVQQTGSAVIGAQAKDGKLLWRHSKRAYRTAVIPTPIVKDNSIYLTVGYRVGCFLLTVKPNDRGGFQVKEEYANNVLESKHGGAILHEGHIYGHHDQNRWVCQDFATGKEIWGERSKLSRRNRSGSLTFAEGHLYLYSDNGVVAMIEASAKGWNEKGRFSIPQQSKIRSNRGGVWSHPVVANGRLYVRDQELIFCYDISAK